MEYNGEYLSMLKLYVEIRDLRFALLNIRHALYFTF
jgi:hypothetical protein